MATKSVSSQNTELYVLSANTLVNVAQVTGITSIGAGSTTKIDLTTLTSTAKETLAGLRDNGTVSFDLIMNPADTSQQALAGLSANTVETTWLVCLSDGNTAPTANSGVVTPPLTRTSAMFNGALDQFQLDLAIDSVGKVKASVLVSGPVTWTFAT